MKSSAAKPKANKQISAARNLRTWSVSCLIFMTMTSYCNYSRDKNPNNKNTKELRTSDGQEDMAGTNGFAQLQDQLFKPLCVSCHNSSQKSGGVDLESFESIVASRGSRTKAPILVPGKPQESTLFISIVTGQMPPGPKKPSRESIGALAAWIESLASNSQPPAVSPAPAPRPVPVTPTLPTPVEPAPAPPTPPNPVEPAPVPPTLPTLPTPPTPPTPEQPAPAPPEPQPKKTFADIQKKLIDEHCIFCHEGEYASGNVNLETYGGLVKESTDGRPPLVIPRNLEQSLLYQSIIRSENPMPPGDERLPQDLVDLVKTWIETGAEP